MTEQELQTLVAALRASPDANIVAMIAPATRNDNALMEYLNAKHTPATKAWRTSVPPADSDEAPDYTVFDSIVPGKRESWHSAFLKFPRDFTKVKVRKWVTDIWGNATANSNSEEILKAATENATRAEVLMGGTTVDTGTVSALKRNWTGTVSLTELSNGLNRY